MFQIAGQIILMSSDQPWQLGFKFLECQISVVARGGEEEEVSPAQYLYFLVRLSVCRRGAQWFPLVSQCVISWEQCSHVWFLLNPGETTEQHNWSTVSPRQDSLSVHLSQRMSLNLNHENWLCWSMMDNQSVYLCFSSGPEGQLTGRHYWKLKQIMTEGRTDKERLGARGEVSVNLLFL